MFLDYKQTMQGALYIKILENDIWNSSGKLRKKIWISGCVPDHVGFFYSVLFQNIQQWNRISCFWLVVSWVCKRVNPCCQRWYYIDKFDPRILSWSMPWSVTHSQCWLPNERENNLVSSVCGSVGIKYSSQILQSCSKLGGSFRHSVSFQCLFKLRN